MVFGKIYELVVGLSDFEGVFDHEISFLEVGEDFLYFLALRAFFALSFGGGWGGTSFQIILDFSQCLSKQFFDLIDFLVGACRNCRDGGVSIL